MATTRLGQLGPLPSGPRVVADAANSPHLGRQSTLIRRWFTHLGRSLPWRDLSGPGRPWGVMMSEFMLQQTPVDRVLPVWQRWWERWPTPKALAAEPAAAALRAWGRLGYPRRALRLHATAGVLARDYNGQVPNDVQALTALPGVGEYTAGAILAFAFDRPALALDTNVRRVVARHDLGLATQAPSITAAERAHAHTILPRRHGAQWMAAVMELGAVVCTARNPQCAVCPVSASCRWRAAGYPEGSSTRRQPRYEGSDRQARGALLDVLREADGPVTGRRLDLAWPEPQQRARALDGLVADGLIVPIARGRWALPDEHRP